MRSLFATVVAVLLYALLPGTARADSIYVIGDSHTMVTAARTHLQSLGHTVTFASSGLSNYSAYDQVWDLRYAGNISSADASAMGNYLAGGGRMYLSGEHSGFDSSRNGSLVNFLSGVGAGNLNLVGNFLSGQESVTAAGQVVNSPNTFNSVAYQASRTVTSGGNGFLVTSNGGGVGSLVGWDLGDITGKAGARMLVGFDIEIFGNGPLWTQNMATYLSAAPAPVPLPAAAWAGMALFGLIGAKRLRRKASDA